MKRNATEREREKREKKEEKKKQTKKRKKQKTETKKEQKEPPTSTFYGTLFLILFRVFRRGKKGGRFDLYNARRRRHAREEAYAQNHTFHRNSLKEDGKRRFVESDFEKF